MPEKYIVGQLKKADSACVVMERKMIGEVEVYAEIVPAGSAAQAEQIASALNAQHEAEIRAEEAPSEVARVQSLYAGGPHAVGVQIGEIDVEKTVDMLFWENTGMAFALAEANGYAFQPDHLVGTEEEPVEMEASAEDLPIKKVALIAHGHFEGVCQKNRFGPLCEPTEREEVPDAEGAGD